MKLKRDFLFWLVLLFFTCVLGFAQTNASSPAGWTLTWSDEFNGPNGSAVDTTKWVIEAGGNGWGNHELEYYTSRQQNVFLRDGNLVIKAQQEKFTGPDGVTRD